MSNGQLAPEIEFAGVDLRPNALLVNTAWEIPAEAFIKGRVDRMGAGVRFIPWGCNGIVLHNEELCTYLKVGTDVDGNYEPTFDELIANGFEDEVFNKAFSLIDAVACSSIDTTHEVLRARVAARLELMASEGLATELLYGYSRSAVGSGDLAGEGAHTLPGDAIVVTAADTSLASALIAAEEFLATKLHGGIGMVHVSPGILSSLVTAGSVRLDDGYWVTGTGHRVVADAGYVNMPPPTGESDAGVAQHWIYATGPVWYRIDDSQSHGAPNQESMTLPHNDEFALTARKAVFAYDPCSVGAVSVVVTNSGSGGDGGLTDVAATTATLSNVNDAATSATLLAAAASRLGVLVFNDSSADLYLKYGATASATSFSVKILAGGYWEMPTPIYTGVIDGIWSADSSGAARITELT